MDVSPAAHFLSQSLRFKIKEGHIRFTAPFFAHNFIGHDELVVLFNLELKGKFAQQALGEK